MAERNNFLTDHSGNLRPTPYILRTKQGQVMIEALVALSIIIIGVLGLLALVSRSLSLNAVASSQYVAANLAGEGIEVVKNIIDGNVMRKDPWNQGINAGDYQVEYSSTAVDDLYGGDPLLFDSATGLYGYSTGAPTTYRRKVSINVISSEEIGVMSTVDWTTRDGASFKIAAQDYFFNWR